MGLKKQYKCTSSIAIPVLSRQKRCVQIQASVQKETEDGPGFQNPQGLKATHPKSCKLTEQFLSSFLILINHLSTSSMMNTLLFALSK